MSRESVACLTILAPPAAGLVALVTWWPAVFGASVASGVAWGLCLCASIAVGVVAAGDLLAQED